MILSNAQDKKKKVRNVWGVGFSIDSTQKGKTRMDLTFPSLDIWHFYITAASTYTHTIYTHVDNKTATDCSRVFRAPFSSSYIYRKELCAALSLCVCWLLLYICKKRLTSANDVRLIIIWLVKDSPKTTDATRDRSTHFSFFLSSSLIFGSPGFFPG